MTTKMKGLLKGLRYISQIFETKEPEMQIGHPTDVKHVAHIGWDGPSINPPTWMNEFRSAPLSTLGAEAMADASPAQHRTHHELSRSVGGTQDSPLLELREPPAPKQRRRASSAGATTAESPTRSPGAPKHSRRNKSIAGVSADGGLGTPSPIDFPARDLPLIPKVARKKKPKAAEGGGGSSRAPKSRAASASLSDGCGGAAEEGNTVEQLLVVAAAAAASSPGPRDGGAGITGGSYGYPLPSVQ